MLQSRKAPSSERISRQKVRKTAPTELGVVNLALAIVDRKVVEVIDGNPHRLRGGGLRDLVQSELNRGKGWMSMATSSARKP